MTEQSTNDKAILVVVGIILLALLLGLLWPGCIVENRNAGSSNFGADQHSRGEHLE